MIRIGSSESRLQPPRKSFVHAPTTLLLCSIHHTFQRIRYPAFLATWRFCPRGLGSPVWAGDYRDEIGEGNWTLLHSENSQTNDVSFVARMEGRSLHIRLDIAESDGELILCSNYSDPDQWEFIEYRKDG